MAKLSLRQYNREIENLIDQGQTEEAVAHCKHILIRFPKCLDSYRLLGKAFLDAGQYSEASDIFQRTLACGPDDFVAHVGMSIIREAEQNLDAAIWHMERAFDIQPSNPAVQEELVRLIGLRDGAEPGKIRLTRGALIRMYSRGNLYQQAIAEIRAALREEADRYDLRVQLARLYWLASMKVEAAELCTALLNEYPYCQEANRILVDILPETSRSDDAKVFEERLFALDPYTRFLTPTSASLANVADQSVMIERLGWRPGLQEDLSSGAYPETDETLPEAQTDYESPAWFLPELDTPLSSDSAPKSDSPAQESAPFQPGTTDTLDPFSIGQSAQAESEATLIPEWMKGAGWTIGSGEAEEPGVFPAGNEDDLKEEEIGEIYSADIPSWIQSLAPKDSDATPGEVAFAQPLQQVEEPETELPEIDAEDLLGQIPEWLNPMIQPAAEEPEVVEAPDDDITASTAVTPSEWQLDALAQQEVPTPVFEVEEILPAVEPLDDPDAAVSPTVLDEAEPTLPESPVAEFIPDVPAPVKPDDATIVVQDETTAWLESLAAIYGSEKETVIARPSDRVKSPPTWILDGSHLPTSSQPTEEPAVNSLPPSTAAPEQVPADGVAEIFPAWDEEPAVDDQIHTSLFPKIEGWELEFHADQPNVTAPLAQEDRFAPEPDARPGTAHLDENEVENLVSDVMPSWQDAIETPPAKPVEPYVPLVTAPLFMEDTPLVTTAPLHLQDHPLVTAPLHLGDEGFEDTALPPSQTPASPGPLDQGPAAALDRARSYLMAGDISPAVTEYNQVIDTGQLIDQMIDDLQQALYRYPVEPVLWETLGNAYARIDKIQDALDAYTKAEELVH